MAGVEERLAERAAEVFVGRDGDLSILRTCLQGDGPLVVYVHGLAGIGKSTLLEAFAREARAKAAVVVRLDCRSFATTEDGFLHAVATSLGAGAATLEAIDERIAGLQGRVLLLLDTYELAPHLDTWLRTTFMPALGDRLRLLVAGRLPPSLGWRSAPEWHGLFVEVALPALSQQESSSLLARLGIPPDTARRIQRIARGHPLALTLGAYAAHHGPRSDLEDATVSQVVAEMTQTFLSQAGDDQTRQALEAGCTVRRVTRSLLGAMLPEMAPQDAFERLQALPFVSPGTDGLLVHDAVRDAVAASLRAADPARYRAYRRAAWRLLRGELEGASRTELSRYTADLLYMIDDPGLHEAFFPGTTPELSVIPARPHHQAEIESIIRRHEGPEASRCLMEWWRLAPEAFSVALDGEGQVAGFNVLLEAQRLPPGLGRTDPVAATWAAHLRRYPLSGESVALLLRTWLSRREGPDPSPVQSAIWLDIKRLYMTLQPRLRRVYMAPLRNPAPYAESAERLGFRPLGGPPVTLDGVPYAMGVLDMGPLSVHGWLSRLLAAEIGAYDDVALAPAEPELVLDGERVALTRLEAALLRCLRERPGQVITQAELLQEVWGYETPGTSNVVAVAVRSLRRKLGSRADAIENVRGVGYRLRNSAL